MKLNFSLKIAFSLLLAGISISLGTYVYLQVQGLAGAVLYGIGLLASSFFRFVLFTGNCYKVSSLLELACLSFLILCNGIGCWLASLCVTDPGIIQLCKFIVEERSQLCLWEAIVKGMGCGFIFGLLERATNKKGGHWLLFIGAPAFILAGFNYAITDIFCYCVGHSAVTWSALWILCGTIAGNFIGSGLHLLGNLRLKE